MYVSLIPVILGSHVLIASTAGLPSIDVQKLCHAAEGAMAALGGEPLKVFDACVSDEQDARTQLLKDWATYPSPDKATCVRVKDFQPSYVEWITCVEMARALRKIRQAPGAKPPG
jgi:hypothetical protein